jgi:hypothetical protein
MTRSVLIVVAPAVLALGLAPAAVGQGQTPAQKSPAKEGRRSGTLFAPGANVGKTLYLSQGFFRPCCLVPWVV